MSQGFYSIILVTVKVIGILHLLWNAESIPDIVRSWAGAGKTDFFSSAKTGIKEEPAMHQVPSDIYLSQNCPNPFNPTTTIEFIVRDHGYTTLKVYNILGQEVTTLFQQIAEPHQRYHAVFQALSLSSGIYLSVLESGACENRR